MKKIAVILLSISLFVACKSNKKDEANPETAIDERSVQEKIADAYGIKNWHKVEEIRFTFNVDRPDNHYERAWSWKPKTSDVTVQTEEGDVSFNTKNLAEGDQVSDQRFINDKYWLLAPFQLIWDSTANITTKDSIQSPIGGELLGKLTITYPAEGGYTPGDAYDLYYDQDYLIKEWVFRKGNASEPSMITTWEKNEDFNGITLSTSHYSPDRELQLYFTNVEVIMN
ncbi:hypothetical protein [Spongiivirga citrea]|uniref:Selenophosphate synthetase n=1 Tax=Spongiivirga citrea TaxID=1481457 RepID=A0A6M0CKH1_9FLAO|nr:hypothetical protein [Spongiivirga citrea]NER18361.1 hypothetical protein [Spongiivirga citrea]